MSRNLHGYLSSSCRAVALASLIAASPWMISTAQSQGIQQPGGSNPATQRPAPATQGKTAANGQQQKAAPKPVDASRFRPPAKANVDQLVEFLADMVTYMPETPQAAELYQTIAPKEMNAAAKLVLQHEKDQKSDNFKFAQKYLMAVEAMTIGEATPQRRQQFMGQIAAILQSPDVDSDDLDIAVTFAEGLEIAGDLKMATAAYSQFSNILSKSKDPLAGELSKLMAGAARRLNLVGNPIQVVGTTVEGKPFNWNQYRGRVVLVDFWATWCGPCLRELPNVRKMYDAYHEKGFEVIGVSMDEDRARLDDFITKNPMPWTTLHEDKGMNPTAIHYGISTLPATLLIDQKGNVITMDARGPELEAQLARLLGPLQR